MVSIASPVSLTGASPASNIMLLPPLGGMTFSITTTGGWYDTLNFLQPSGLAVLDISGIDFHAQLRKTATDSQNILDFSTLNVPPQLVNGGTNGNLYFSADVSFFKNLKPGVYAMDILAIDTVTSMVRNLCELAPIAVTVNQGVTR